MKARDDFLSANFAFRFVLFTVLFIKEVDETKPEKRRTPRHKDKREG
jgi:hypothetical protein